MHKTRLIPQMDYVDFKGKLSRNHFPKAGIHTFT